MNMQSYLIEFQSKAALQDFLAAGPLPYLVLGSDSEAPREFYAVDIWGRLGKPYRIGIISSGSGIRPSLVHSTDREYWAIGYHSRIGIVDADNACLISETCLDGVFFEFIICDSNDEFVAVHELGAAKFRFSGAKVCSISTDILESWRKDPGDKLILRQQEDGKEIVVDLKDCTGPADCRAADLHDNGDSYNAQ